MRWTNYQRVSLLLYVHKRNWQGVLLLDPSGTQCGKQFENQLKTHSVECLSLWGKTCEKQIKKTEATMNGISRLKLRALKEFKIQIIRMRWRFSNE